MKLFRKENLFGTVYAITLVCFTVYAVLDTFVISHVYDVVPKSSDGSYTTQYDESPSISISPMDTSTVTSALGVTSISENNVSSEVVTSDSGGVEQVTTTLQEETVTTQEVQVTEMTMPPNVYSSMFTADGSVIVTDGSYTDGNMCLMLSQYREYDSDIYVADIYLSTPTLLKTAFTNDKFGRYITASTSDTAEEHNAILAINGDYYGSKYDGYVLRNGELYRSSAVSDNEDLAIMKDGTFQIFNEDEVSAEDLLNAGAQQILSFGPALLIDGENIIDKDKMTGISKSHHPRTAIGIVDNLHYVFVVVDGRTDESRGVTAYELAEFMRNIGAQTAYNLDGGGSSTMYFNGRVINTPTTHGDVIEQREVSDIVYIGY